MFFVLTIIFVENAVRYWWLVLVWVMCLELVFVSVNVMSSSCTISSGIKSKYSLQSITRPGGAMVAQQTSNLKVVGSSPTSGVIFAFFNVQFNEAFSLSR